MGIGWIIFWKCVIVGVWAGIVTRWQTYKQERGVELKPNRKGVYVVRPCYVDMTFRWLRLFFLGTLFLWWAAIALAFLIGGKTGATALVEYVLLSL